MFTRKHRIGRHSYIEVRESYRDPATGRPRHRCFARWHAERSFARELGRTRFAIEQATHNIAFWQGLIDRTVRPRFPKQRRRAPESVRFWQRKLETATAHLSALTLARDAGLSVDDGEIERARQAEAGRWAGISASMRTMFQHPAVSDITGFAARVRRLALQNDPVTLRAEIAAIAADLEALSPRS